MFMPIIFILIFYISNFIKNSGLEKISFLLMVLVYLMWIVYIYEFLTSLNI